MSGGYAETRFQDTVMERLKEIDISLKLIAKALSKDPIGFDGHINPMNEHYFSNTIERECCKNNIYSR